MTSNAQTIQSTVRGFLVEVYSMPGPTGERMYGLSPTDFEKVRSGYACAKCLAEYGQYTPVCVVCGEQRDIAADIAQAPAYWQESVDERENDRTPYAKPSKTPFDDMMRNLAHDPDVENVNMSDLRKRKGTRRN